MNSFGDDGWGELLVKGFPNVGLLDDLQLDGELHAAGMALELGGLGSLGFDELGAGGNVACAGVCDHAPTGSDLLESLQLDAAAFLNPASSSDTQHLPSNSGSDSPVVLPSVSPSSAATGSRGAAPRCGANGGQASPATSETENNGRGRSDSPLDANSQRTAQAGSAPAHQPQRQMTDEEKRLARMQRNRENAQLSRQRKKQQMADLEARCAGLTKQNAQLAGVVQRLTAENAQLRQQLVLMCQQTARATAAQAAGRAAPAAPASAKAAAATHPPSAGAAAKAAQSSAGAAPKGLLPHCPLLPFGILPKGLPQAPQQPRPAHQAPTSTTPSAAGSAKQCAAAGTGAAPSAAPQPAPQAKAAAPAAAGRPAKRAKRAAAGASTAFLALFTLFMFAGPFTPLSTPGSNNISAAVVGSQRTLQALPDTANAADSVGGFIEGSLHRTGRGLQALPASASDGRDASLPPQALQLEGSHLQQLLNSTLQALREEPGNTALEAAALQRLQELGPVALLLDADAGPSSTPGHNPLAASTALPHLAGQLFGAAGLEVPQMCHKVLEFDAASLPHAVRSRRSLERYVLGATGFRGRSLAASSGSVAGSSGSGGAQKASEPQLLRIEQQMLIGDHMLGLEEESSVMQERAPAASPSSTHPSSTALLPSGSSSQGPVLVSVLLPANASGDTRSPAKLASIDKVFVVLLHPQDKYTTYSCALPRPVVL